MEADQPPRSGPFPIAAVSGALLVVVAAWLVLHAWGLDKTPFHTKGEPREAVMVTDIVQNGRWILPLRAGVEPPAKPPLFHWLGALASHALGAASEQSIRLPSALCSGASAILLFVCVARIYGPLAALAAALALLTCFEWTRAATSARVDMTLAFGMTLSFCGLLMRRLSSGAAWSLLIYAGMIWSALTKGPVGIALPLLQVALLSAVDRGIGFAREIRLVRGVVCVLLVVALWYGLAFAEGGRSFFAKQVLDENVYRFLGSARLTGGHRHSIGYLAGMLALGLLPWTLFLPTVAADLWRGRSTLSRRDPRLFAVLWSLLIFAFYAQAASKRGVYLLPIYPALCLLLGSWASALLRRDGNEVGWPIRVAAGALGWGLAAICGAVGVLAAVSALGAPLLLGLIDFLPARAARDVAPVLGALDQRPLPLAALLLVAALCAALAALSAPARRWGTVLGGFFGAIAALTVCARQLVLPEVARAETRRRFVSAVRQQPIDAVDLHAFRNIDYGFAFYWGRNLPLYDGPLTARAPRSLVMSEAEWSRRDAVGRALYERIPNLDSGRAGNLGPLVIARRLREETR